MRISDWSSDVFSSDLHMIGAQSMESAILGGYAAYVRQHHPKAPTPGFYRSADLVASAHGLRDKMGDERFFAALAGGGGGDAGWGALRSEEHTSELQSLMRISYAVFCLKKKIQQKS